MKFKKYLSEMEDNITVPVLKQIQDIIGTMSDDTIYDFKDWLYNALDDDGDFDDDADFDGDNDSDGDEGIDIDDKSNHDEDIESVKAELIELIGSLKSEDLNYILYMIQDEDEDDDIDTHYVNNIDDNDVQERMAARFKAGNRNKKKNLRFQKTKAEFRAGKAARKRDNRKNKAKNRAKYRKNKVRIKKYQKSYKDAVKSGKHFKKIRR